MRELTEAAKAAKLIKHELKKHYPRISFSVTSDTFSMGDAVDIHWINGPTVEDVERITDKYQLGHFNSMEDIYEYSNRRDDIPQAQYISCHRKYTPEAFRLALEWVNVQYGYHLRVDERGDFVDRSSDEFTGNGWASHKVHQHLNHCFISPDGSLGFKE